MDYFKKNEDDTYSKVDVDEVFKDRKERWVKSESTKIREEVETTVRAELTPKLTTEIEEKVKGEYEPKLTEANKKVTELDTSLRRTTIAAEYGFKPETAEFLGNGTDDDMRKKADTLKTNFASGIAPPEKKTGAGNTPAQTRSGLKVTI